MDETKPATHASPTYLIAGRLTFTQLLLVTTYTFLRSCLPFRTGDDRQILDVLRRNEKDWRPRIGSEGVSALISRNHEAGDSRSDWNWEEIRRTLIQAHCRLPVSTTDLRDQLRYILNQLEQISADGLNTITENAQRLPPKKPFGSRGTVVLLCFSLSVVPSGPLPPFHWELDDSTIKDMMRHLNKSPLFPDGISLHELRTALSSLELLFSCEDIRVSDFQRRERERKERRLLELIRLSYDLPHVPASSAPL